LFLAGKPELIGPRWTGLYLIDFPAVAWCPKGAARGQLYELLSIPENQVGIFLGSGCIILWACQSWSFSKSQAMGNPLALLLGRNQFPERINVPLLLDYIAVVLVEHVRICMPHEFRGLT
jgi:hypothetical protein